MLHLEHFFAGRLGDGFGSRGQVGALKLKIPGPAIS